MYALGQELAQPFQRAFRCVTTCFYHVTPVIGLNHTLRIRTGKEFLAHLNTNVTNIRRYLIWIGSEQAKTFGPTISGLIRRHMVRERITIWDSKYQGTYRPLSSTIFGLKIRRHRRTP